MALPIFIGEKMAKHILSCSFGKDSITTALLALQHGEPLDELVLNAGKIKAFRIGRSYRIPKVNVIRFLQNETPEDCNTVNATIDSVE